MVLQLNVIVCSHSLRIFRMNRAYTISVQDSKCRKFSTRSRYLSIIRNFADRLFFVRMSFQTYAENMLKMQRNCLRPCDKLS